MILRPEVNPLMAALVPAFNQPTAVTFAPGGRMFVAEKDGVVWAVRNGVRQPLPLIDLNKEVLSNIERGLLGLAVDPSFDSNGYLAQRPNIPEPHSLAPGDTGINASFVSRYRVYAQHSGNDVGTYTRVNVSTKSFRVYFTG